MNQNLGRSQRELLKQLIVFTPDFSTFATVQAEADELLLSSPSMSPVCVVAVLRYILNVK